MVIVQVANLEDIYAERDACGVGYIASLRNEASHKIVRDALTSLGCMEHRGGCGADNDSGDGAGVMTSIPWGLFKKWFKDQGLPEVDESHCGVGQVFLPRDEALAASAKAGNLLLPFFIEKIINSLCKSTVCGLEFKKPVTDFGAINSNKWSHCQLYSIVLYSIRSDPLKLLVSV